MRSVTGSVEIVIIKGGVRHRNVNFLGQFELNLVNKWAHRICLSILGAPLIHYLTVISFLLLVEAVLTASYVLSLFIVVFFLPSLQLLRIFAGYRL